MNDRVLSLPAMLLFLVMGIMGIVIGPLLYLWPAGTQGYFAWTITDPLSAVFVGGCYCGFITSFWVVGLNRWSVARVFLPAIIMLALTQIIAIALHLDRLRGSNPLTWAWLIGHGFMLLVAPFVLWANRYGDRAPAAMGRALPPSFGPVMKSWAVVLTLIGLVLFFIPQQISAVLAWSPSPLDSQVLGSWHFAAAALQWSLGQQRTLATAHVGLFMNLLVVALLLIAAPFHRDAFNGPRLTIAVYFVILLGLGGFSALSGVTAWRNRAPSMPTR